MILKEQFTLIYLFFINDIKDNTLATIKYWIIDYL